MADKEKQAETKRMRFESDNDVPGKPQANQPAKQPEKEATKQPQKSGGGAA